MRKPLFLAVCILVLLSTFSGCWWEHDTSITTREGDDEYEMSARYERYKARKIEKMIRQELEDRHNISFSSNEMDEDVTLDDRTTFHIYSHPGKIEIKFDKNDNSAASCERVRALCDEIKEILEDQ
jgi:hypothetical protein